MNLNFIVMSSLAALGPVRLPARSNLAPKNPPRETRPNHGHVYDGPTPPETRQMRRARERKEGK